MLSFRQLSLSIRFVLWYQALVQGQTTRCGCQRCGDAVLSSEARNATCESRIDYMRSQDGGSLNETEACLYVAKEFPDICGPACHPFKCREDVPDYCGCFSCTDEALDRVIEGDVTCRSRIRQLQQNGMTEEEACLDVTSEFFLECGASCNPEKCDFKKPSLCGCDECTEQILQSKPGQFSCYERIQFIRKEKRFSELEACEEIATEYPRICGPSCNPSKCDGRKPPFCSCNECTEEILDTEADGFTCFDRMQALAKDPQEKMNESRSCTLVSSLYPDICGPKCHPEKCDGGPLHCGCYNCTEDIWSTQAGQFTCGEHIQYLIDQRIDEHEACATVAERYPDICGPHCHPKKCDDNPKFCDCYECTDKKWSFLAGEETNAIACGARIRSVQQDPVKNLDELGACREVATEHPLECGPSCHPDRCDGRGPPLCSCFECNEDVLSRMAGNFTCYQRILDLMRADVDEEMACKRVSSEFPDICGPSCHPDKCDGQPLHCGCYNCTAEIWNAIAGKQPSTCGSRILYLQTFDGGEFSEADACAQVSREFPKECGLYCDTQTCDGKGTLPSAATIWIPFRLNLVVLSLIAWMWLA